MKLLFRPGGAWPAVVAAVLVASVSVLLVSTGFIRTDASELLYEHSLLDASELPAFTAARVIAVPDTERVGRIDTADEGCVRGRACDRSLSLRSPPR